MQLNPRSDYWMEIKYPGTFHHNVPESDEAVLSWRDLCLQLQLYTLNIKQGFAWGVVVFTRDCTDGLSGVAVAVRVFNVAVAHSAL